VAIRKRKIKTQSPGNAASKKTKSFSNGGRIAQSAQLWKSSNQFWRRKNGVGLITQTPVFNNLCLMYRMGPSDFIAS